MQDKTYRLEIQSDPAVLPQVEEFIEKAVKDSNIEKSELNNLMMAVNEATTNGMLHGNKADINKKVIITLAINNKQVKVTIKDQGNGFDPSKVPDPTTPENIFKRSGRGLFIMKTCMSEVDYKFTPDGTELSLLLKLE